MDKFITIRFYEELNDFLPKVERKKALRVNYTGRQSVKDLIESRGVPHPEAGLILADGISVSFSYIICPGDYISVYPVFKSFDISQISKLITKPQSDIKFIIDSNLGKLAKYMRLLGFDTKYENSYGDKEIIWISNEEKRIILTRDKGVLKSKEVGMGYWVRSDSPKEQAKETLRRFNLFENANPLKRCIKCNGIPETVKKEEIIDRLLPETVKYYGEFWLCPGCGQIYWKGSHTDRMEKLVDELLGKY